MDEIIKNSKRREGNTWREINRIVDQVTEPETESRPKTVPTKTSRLTESMSHLNSTGNSSIPFEPGHTSHNGVIETIRGDACVNLRFASGKIVIKYDNGTIKERSPDGKTEITRFANGDVQHNLPDNSVLLIYIIIHII